MWAYRCMLEISWTQKVTNEEVLRRVGCQRELWKTVKKKKVAYLGHLLRHDRYRLLQLIMMGKVAGKSISVARGSFGCAILGSGLGSRVPPSCLASREKRKIIEN
ncbi:jg13686 [Pararge aegeria aegeria]|uniref:Jg13686 protein n=1 Tax=Pararge aegeria aegeria TaxID=348720 RepID=A0A8S4RRR1_9NEOP|nr:jg13686 [Pararge aegeria aegeria]